MPHKQQLPKQTELKILFAHGIFQLSDKFEQRNTGIAHTQSYTQEDTRLQIADADIAVISGFWRDDLLATADRLCFIQVPAAGYDQFDISKLRDAGVTLATGRGVMANAVAEHALGMMLGFTRHLFTARDNQHKRYWRGMLSDSNVREDELSGKTILIYGFGTIGSRLATLAKAFGMHVIGIKREPTVGNTNADLIDTPKTLLQHLPNADFVVLTCPLTDETHNLIDSSTLDAMNPNGYLVNVARGGCVDMDALILAIEKKSIAGAAIDTTPEEPLPTESPLWKFENVIVTPHTAGDTRNYEDKVVDLLLDNLKILYSGGQNLINQII